MVVFLTHHVRYYLLGCVVSTRYTLYGSRKCKCVGLQRLTSGWVLVPCRPWRHFGLMSWSE